MTPQERFKEVIGSLTLKRSADGHRIIRSEMGPGAAWIFDFRSMLLQSKWLDAYAEIFWEAYGSSYPFQVCGMESAAISLVAAIVMKGVERGTPVNGLYIRKSRKREGLMKIVEGTPSAEVVILVDDLINSGNTFSKEVLILEEVGLRVSDIYALVRFRGIDTYAFAQKRGIRIQTLCSISDFGLTEEPQTNPSEDALETLWRFSAPEPSHQFVAQKSAPATDGASVYFGTDAGTFFALDAMTGSVRWEFKIGKHPEGKGIFSSPIVSDGLVYFGAYDGNVYALDSKDGGMHWVYSDADWIGSSPAIAKDLGMLFIGLEFGLFRRQGGVIALSLSTGRRIWEDHTAKFTHGSPLYIPEEGLVVVGSNDGIVYGYDARSGVRRWAYGTGGDIKSRAAYDFKRRAVICGSMDGKLYFISARDGMPLFAKQTNAGIYSTPLIEGRTLYATSLDKCLYAIDLDTYADCWQLQTRGRIFASPVIADGSIWIGSNDGRLYELDPGTGWIRSFFQATERIVNAIAYNEKSRLLYVPTCANEIYCIARKR